MTKTVTVVEDYDLACPCLTLDEVRWILKTLGRYSAYYTYFLLRITTGVRGSELLDHATLYNFSPRLHTFRYRVDKFRVLKQKRSGKVVGTIELHKHRRVELDDFSQQELKIYLDRMCRVVDNIYISKHDEGKLFGWKRLNVVNAYWHKVVKTRAKKEGFDVERKEKNHTRTINGEWGVKRGLEGERVFPVYVWRLHMLRHFAATIMYYKFGMDLKRVQSWIKHSDISTTQGYVHTAEELGTTAEFLRDASWGEILGFDTIESTNLHDVATSQTNLCMF